MHILHDDRVLTKDRHYKRTCLKHCADVGRLYLANVWFTFILITSRFDQQSASTPTDRKLADWKPSDSVSIASSMRLDRFRPLSVTLQLHASLPAPSILPINRLTDAIVTARSELWKVLFLAPSVCGFFLFVYEISRKPLKEFAPNSHGRRVWSLARTRLKVKVKGQGHQGQKRLFSGPFGGLYAFYVW